MAASLLHAIGLPELVTSTRDDYEALAVALATDPGRLDDIRRKLSANRLTAPLFDAQKHTRYVEAAYAAMYARHQAGLPPDHIRVDR
jgi:predicted O-linked N-acetylglucosamine transferase (SPINDLY family)